jgi:hypothetical protein
VHALFFLKNQEEPEAPTVKNIIKKNRLQIVQKDRASKAKQGEGIRVQQRTERRARGYRWRLIYK